MGEKTMQEYYQGEKCGEFDFGIGKKFALQVAVDVLSEMGVTTPLAKLGGTFRQKGQGFAQQLTFVQEHPIILGQLELGVRVLVHKKPHPCEESWEQPAESKDDEQNRWRAATAEWYYYRRPDEALKRWLYRVVERDGILELFQEASESKT